MDLLMQLLKRRVKQVETVITFRNRNNLRTRRVGFHFTLRHKQIVLPKGHQTLPPLKEIIAFFFGIMRKT
jgi:hypothetical protein